MKKNASKNYENHYGYGISLTLQPIEWKKEPYADCNAQKSWLDLEESTRNNYNVESHDRQQNQLKRSSKLRSRTRRIISLMHYSS